MSAYERKDAAYRRAKREGYRSRAAYKLAEIDRRVGLLKPGQRVVDLGCWPGAWLQYAAERVGPRGRVVGVDKVATDDLGRDNVRILTGDVGDEAIRRGVEEALGGPADLVLSDMAPKLSGIQMTDAVRHAELVRVALARARTWLRPTGSFIAKLFMDAEYEGLVREIRESFHTVRTLKPDSTRKGSAELYVCATGPKEPAADSA